MEWTKISINTLIPQIPSIIEKNNKALQNYLDIFYDGTKGVIIKPILTTGRVKASSGEFVNMVVDNLSVKNQYTNIYSNITMADTDFLNTYNAPAFVPRDSSIWEQSNYKYIDVNKPYYKISNTNKIALKCNTEAQIVRIIFDTSLASNNAFFIQMDPSDNTKDFLVYPSDASTTFVELMVSKYDPSYGTNWILYKYGVLDPSYGGIGGGGGSGSVTSVGMTTPIGLSVLNSPITDNGTLELNFTPGYSIPTIGMQTDWSTGYLHSQITAGNPHGITKNTIGLSNVTNDAQIPLSQKAANNGVATLDAGGKVPQSQLPLSGSVTSIGMSVPSGLAVSPSNITSSGIFNITMQSGYSIPAISAQSNWNTGYNHSQISGNPHNTSTLKVANTSSAALLNIAMLNHTSDSSILYAGSNLTIQPSTGNVSVGGTITAANFILSSDLNLKENIIPINSPDISNINIYEFNFKTKPNEKRYGVIAQELEEYYPELVHSNILNNSERKYVDYIEFLLVKVANLESRMKNMESLNN